jgi:methionyl-tRNA formyltransferase
MAVGLLSTINSPLLGYTLKAMLEQDIDIAAVLLDSKDFSEKDMLIWNQRTGKHLPLILPSYFDQARIPFYFVDNHSSQSTIEIVKQLDLKLLVNGGTPRILKNFFLNSLQFGVLNIHPGKLPDYRGCTCPEWAIYNNDQIYNTVHFMTDEIDSGSIVIDEAYKFPMMSDYVDIRVKVYRNGFVLLAKAVKKILRDCTISSSGPILQGGKYYKPIPEKILNEIKKKINSGNYKYQCT